MMRRPFDSVPELPDIDRRTRNFGGATSPPPPPCAAAQAAGRCGEISKAANTIADAIQCLLGVLFNWFIHDGAYSNKQVKVHCKNHFHELAAWIVSPTARSLS